MGIGSRISEAYHITRYKAFGIISRILRQSKIILSAQLPFITHVSIPEDIGSSTHLAHNEIYFIILLLKLHLEGVIHTFYHQVGELTLYLLQAIKQEILSFFHLTMSIYLNYRCKILRSIVNPIALLPVLYRQ